MVEDRFGPNTAEVERVLELGGVAAEWHGRLAQGLGSTVSSERRRASRAGVPRPRQSLWTNSHARADPNGPCQLVASTARLGQGLLTGRIDARPAVPSSLALRLRIIDGRQGLRECGAQRNMSHGCTANRARASG